MKSIKIISLFAGLFWTTGAIAQIDSSNYHPKRMDEGRLHDTIKHIGKDTVRTKDAVPSPGYKGKKPIPDYMKKDITSPADSMRKSNIPDVRKDTAY